MQRGRLYIKILYYYGLIGCISAVFIILASPDYSPWWGIAMALDQISCWCCVVKMNLERKALVKYCKSVTILIVVADLFLAGVWFFWILIPNGA